VNPPGNTARPVTSYTYNAFGQVLTKTDPTGLVTQTTYHATNGNVLSVILNPGTSPNIAATTVFAYDTAANVTQITDPRGFVHTATYDAMRRLTSYTAPTSTNAKTKWTYDADGLTHEDRAGVAIIRVCYVSPKLSKRRGYRCCGSPKT
jgi:YD repeat-containing protein